MYVPHYFDDSSIEEVNDFIRENSFGILVNQTKGRLWATHIPMELVDENSNSRLVGHISRGNQQWKGFKEKDEVLAIFQGPHSYVSSSWYNHDNVPTWNYVAVHVYGKVKIIEGKELYQSLEDLIDKYEGMTKTHLRIKDMPASMVQREIKGIVGFEILIDEVQAAFKLSQNRDNESYENVTKELGKGEFHESKNIAKLMAQRKNK